MKSFTAEERQRFAREPHRSPEVYTFDKIKEIREKNMQGESYINPKGMEVRREQFVAEKILLINMKEHTERLESMMS